VNALERILGAGKRLVGVVHLAPLPGSPLWGGEIGVVSERAVSDAAALERAGFDGIIIENFGDVPFARGFAGRGAVAAMGAVGARVRDRVRVPLGVNVLRNDPRSAVSVAAAIDAGFIRVNVHVGAAVTDQGVIESEAMETMRAIRATRPDLAVFADLMVKHAAPLGEFSLERSAADAVERGLASAVIVTGDSTGSAASLEEVERAAKAVPGTPVLIGSGVTIGTVGEALRVADGVIVGTAIMVDGRAGRPIDEARAAEFVRAARAGSA
jgi:membrane complex biogenesis BtpA family protein